MEREKNIMENKNEASISINLNEGNINITGSELFVEKNMDKIFDFVNNCNFTYSLDRKTEKSMEIQSQLVEKPKYEGIQRMAGEVQTDLKDKYVLGGVYHVDAEDGTISILKSIPGTKKSEKIKNIALIVLSIRKDKIEGKEIIPICEKHNCFDSANFSSIFKNEKTNIIRKGNGKNWTIELTQPGELAAKELLEEMLNGNK